MNKTLLGNWRASRQIPHITLASGIGWGLIGGLVGTMVMDLVLMAALAAAGLPVLYVEIINQPILATTPILLKMTGPETWQWFSSSFAMHMIWGAVLGGVVSHGLAVSLRSKAKLICCSTGSGVNVEWCL